MITTNYSHRFIKHDHEPLALHQHILKQYGVNHTRPFAKLTTPSAAALPVIGISQMHVQRARSTKLSRPRAILVVCAVLILGIVVIVFGLSSKSSVAPGYYVSPSGSDNNAGTATAPFATLSKCQNAMRRSSTRKTCYIGPGIYHPSNAGIGCSADSNALNLTSLDTGETWAYNPADGYDTAIIDGGSTASGIGLDNGICIEAPNVTIDGLQLQHFQSSFIRTMATNTTIANNIVHDSYNQPFVAAIMLITITRGSHVTHNVVYNVASNGITVHSCNGGYGGCSQGISNDVIEYNVVYNYCYDDYDCGAIGLQDYDTPRSTNVLVAYNYVRDGDLIGPSHPVNDGGGIGGGRALYMDDGTSNVTLQGNIVTGKNQLCFDIHGGSNDIYKNNICDLQPPAANQNIGNTGMFILYFQNSPEGNGMTRDYLDSNIIISSDPRGGYGYGGNGTAPTGPEISNSVYYNYASGPKGPCFSGGVNYCGSAGHDRTPQSMRMLFNPCPTDGADPWSFELKSTSAALRPPVSFPQPPNDRSVAWGRPGFWGPPGYLIPHTGNPPSYHPCSA